MPNNTNITKKLKIAFKRWFKQSKAAGWDGFSEPFMASALFIINISQKHQQFQNLSFDELIRTVFYDDKNYFIEQQNKQLEKAKTFAEVQKLSEKETQELITKTKEKLALEMQKHQEQINTTLKYFDYKINDSGDISENYEESKAIINKLDKLGYSAIFIKELKIVYEKGKNIGELSSKYLNNGYEIVTSGTFFYNGVPLVKYL